MYAQNGIKNIAKPSLGIGCLLELVSLELANAEKFPYSRLERLSGRDLIRFDIAHKCAEHTSVSEGPFS
jgi:hypothetical protein